MTRPFDKHLDSDELDGLVSLHAASVTDSGRPSEQALEEARRHVESCQDCSRKVQMHKSVQSEISRLRAASHVRPGPDCVAEVEWLNVAAGLLAETKITELLKHASKCRHCGPLLRKAVETLSDETTPEEEGALERLLSARPDWHRTVAEKLKKNALQNLGTSKEHKTWSKGIEIWPRWAFVGAALTLFIVVGWLRLSLRTSRHEHEASQSTAATSVEQLLAKAYTEQRTLEMRIEGARYALLSQSRGMDRSQSRMSLPTSLLDAEAAIARNLKSHPDDSTWLQAQGRADLLEGNYEAAISTLQKAERIAPDNPAIEIDLATAYFIRGEKLGRIVDYGEAVQKLGRVTALHPNDSLAQFNYALALEKSEFPHGAIAEWHKFLQLDPNSEWASEARVRLSALEEQLRKNRDRSEKLLKNPDEFIAAFNSGRQESISEIDGRIELYQDLAIEQWLPLAYTHGTWNHLASQTARRAVALLSRLLLSSHEDSWFDDFVREADAGPNSRLAIESLAEAARLNHTSDRDRAIELARKAAKIFRRAGMSAGERRAQFEVIYAEQMVHQNQDCYRSAQKVSTLREPRPYVWLQIQALLESAVCASMSDTRALTLATEARELATRHRYKILQIRATTLLAALSWSVGDPNRAWTYSADGLSRYWAGDYPDIRGYNLYTNLDYLSEDNQEWFLQAAVLREATLMIQSTPDIVLRAIAQARLSQALFMTGDLSAAEASFRETERLFADSPQGSRRRNLQAESEIGLANVELRRGKAQSAATRLQAIRLAISQILDKDLSLSFLQSLGLAQMLAGNRSGAEQTLTLALHLAEEGLGLVSSERKRLEWSRKTEPTYRALVQLTFSDHPERALAYWELYKGASLRGGRRRHFRQFATASSIKVALPDAASFVTRDTAVISYALFDGGTAVWIYDTSGTRGFWLESPRAEIEALARRFDEHCSDPHSDPESVQRDSVQLYERIFLPIEPFLRSHKRLIIETDGALDLIPFEALINPRGTYLGDRYSVTFSSGIDYLIAAGPSQSLSKRSRALVVGNPTSPGWPPLQAAEVEARNVAALFQESQLLLRDAARYPVIARELPKADIFHFSGHATISANDTGLVLGGSDILDVLKLEGLSFRHNKLIVLSACTSAKGTTGMFDDPDGTARLLVAAGVPDVVASRWAVDSDATAILMREFYRQLFMGNSVGDSLHAAAADLRRQDGFSHPFYWASFEVFGRT